MSFTVYFCKYNCPSHLDNITKCDDYIDDINNNKYKYFIYYCTSDCIGHHNMYAFCLPYYKQQHNCYFCDIMCLHQFDKCSICNEFVCNYHKYHDHVYDDIYNIDSNHLDIIAYPLLLK